MCGVAADARRMCARSVVDAAAAAALDAGQRAGSQQRRRARAEPKGGHRTRLEGRLLVFPAGLEDRGWLSAFCHIQSTLTIRALARACACACLQPSSKPHVQLQSSRLPLLSSCTKQRGVRCTPSPPSCRPVPPQLAPAAPPAPFSFAPVPADAPSPLHSTPGPCCCTLDRRRARRSLTSPHHTHDQRSSRRLSTALAALADISALASHAPHLATQTA
jgi:hypothetical protein